MRRCEQCNIILLDDTESCPLCHHAVNEEEAARPQTIRPGDARRQGTSRMYPNVTRRQKKTAVALRALLFAAVVLTLVCGFINYNVGAMTHWSVIVVLPVWYVVFVFFLFNYVEGYMRRVFFGTFAAVAMILAMDILTGFHRWSVNYVLPGSIFLFDLFLLILMIANHRNWQSYMIFQLVIIVIGIAPLILIRTGVVTHPLVSEAAFLSAVLVFLGTLILGGTSARAELKRRFHI